MSVMQVLIGSSYRQQELGDPWATEDRRVTVFKILSCSSGKHALMQAMLWYHQKYSRKASAANAAFSTARVQLKRIAGLDLLSVIHAQAISAPLK
jgi:hypothetical protein